MPLQNKIQSNQDIKRLSVDLADAPYDIYIGEGLLGNIGAYIPFSLENRTVFILTDENVRSLYADKVETVLRSCGAQTHVLTIKGGESSKSFSDYERLSGEMLSHKATRDSLLIALGGGVVGDLGGFLASTIVRGIPYIQVPTTVLAQVDSSVGGKTAINTSFGKNLIGTFYQPHAVIIDLKTLKTLSEREYKAGIAEALKYGIIADFPFFEYIEANVDALNAMDDAVCQKVVYTSCATKADIVALDEKETTGARALLNLGHTFGHALELMAGYNGDVLHGEAVSVGMVMAAQASCDLGDLSEDDVARITALLRALKLPVTIPELGVKVDVDEMYSLMLGDKKATKDGIGFIVLTRIGGACVRSDLSQDFISKLIQKFI